MNRKKYIIALLALIQSSLASTQPLKPQNPTLFIGNIQFPQNLSNLPQVRVFSGGRFITCDADAEAKRLSFSLEEERLQTHFYMLITEDFTTHTTEENIFDYLKTNPSHEYKFYSLRLVQKIKKEADNSTPKITFKWNIHERKIPFSDGRLPDHAIIVFANPDWIESVSGGDAMSFPTVAFKSDIVSIAGSQEKVEDEFDKLLLAAIDHRCTHNRVEQSIKQPSAKTLIVQTRY